MSFFIHIIYEYIFYPNFGVVILICWYLQNQLLANRLLVLVLYLHIKLKFLPYKILLEKGLVVMLIMTFPWRFPLLMVSKVAKRMWDVITWDVGFLSNFQRTNVALTRARYDMCPDIVHTICSTYVLIMDVLFLIYTGIAFG